MRSSEQVYATGGPSGRIAGERMPRQKCTCDSVDSEVSVTPKQLRAVIRGRTPLYEGFLRVYRYEIDVERHDGRVGRLSWEMMERGNAVAVLGHDPRRDEVVLANEFRPGALVAGDYPYRDNLVAGAIEDKETALEAAVREMQEEAGLVLSNPVLINPGAYVSSGGTSEKISIVYGTVDTAHAGGVHGNAAEHEDILTIVLPAKVFIERVRCGDINDLKTLVAGYWFAERQAGK
jgi:ADP-ribose pyrophosphatase